MMEKSLDRKLARILADRASGDFILADAKDADMAYGLAAPGRSPEHHAEEGRFRSLDEYRQLIRENVRQGLVDIMLTSASNNELLTIGQRLFDGSAVTPAVRANDSSDVWAAQGGVYLREPSKPFRSASIDEAMCGKPRCAPNEPTLGADLGLYSVTFNNDLTLDHGTLEAYRAFRAEAAVKNFRHFLEVFDPNAPQSPIPDLARFVNDMIVRTLAGAAGKERPLFLKVVYHGPAAMEQLAGYDSRLIVGVLGGSSGTTYDAFHQLWEAKKHGAARRPLRPDDQQRRASVEFHRASAPPGRRSAGAARGGAFVPCGLAAVENSALSPPRRRSPTDAALGGVRRFAAVRRGETGRRPQSAAREHARLLEDDPSGEARLESGPVEAHPRLGFVGKPHNSPKRQRGQHDVSGPRLRFGLASPPTGPLLRQSVALRHRVFRRHDADAMLPAAHGQRVIPADEIDVRLRGNRFLQAHAPVRGVDHQPAKPFALEVLAQPIVVVKTRPVWPPEPW